ncbi:MAG: type II secretion system protein, partial [Gammaproteobacteria bacterium]
AQPEKKSEKLAQSAFLCYNIAGFCENTPKEKHTMTKQKQSIAQPKRRGVTLIEIAIVLVIIGILLGGVLKGQELINNARVRSIIDQQNGLKVSWFSFLDRFGGMPGDYPFASQYIPQAKDGAGDGVISATDAPQAMQHLTAAGYLKCAQCTQSTPSMVTIGLTNSVHNAYGAAMAIYHVSLAYANRVDNTQPRLMILSGPLIPSNVLQQVDSKADDGVANEGEVVFSEWTGLGGTKPAFGDCMSSSRAAQTDATGLTQADVLYYRHHGTKNPVPNCGFSNNL